MTIDEKLQTLRMLDAESESKMLQTGAMRRGLLGEIEEELRTLRAQVQMQKIETMSEREFAAWLGQSERTVKGYRQAHPERVRAIMVSRIPRYSTWHQVHAHEIYAPLLEAKAKPGRKRSQRSEVRGQKAGVISDSRFQIPERSRPAA